MKKMMGLITIVALFLLTIIVGYRIKHITLLEKRNAEVVKNTKAGNFIVCVDPKTPASVNLAAYNNYVRKVIFVEQNDETSILYGYRFNKLSISDKEMIGYNNFSDCMVTIQEQISPELIGKIILNGFQQPTSSASPDGE